VKPETGHHISQRRAEHLINLPPENLLPGAL
jgi:hypothetical protein